ncbi:MAG: hypothetical protein MJ180_00755 [Candidatus Gastranaerophilales bacterium]|nr:hypothetical protein [Candidatus Gastranaerophilales bacterium]
MTESISFDLYKLNSANSVSEVSDTEKSDETASESKTSNPITISFEGTSTEEHEVDIAECFNTNDKKDVEELQKKYKALKIKAKHSEFKKIYREMIQDFKNLGIDENDPEIKQKMHIYIMGKIAMNKGLITGEEFEKLSKELDTKKVQEIIKDINNAKTSEELEKLLGTLKKEYKHEGSFRSMRDHSRANLIFGKDTNETRQKREEFLLKQAEIQEKENDERLKTASEAISEHCSEEGAEGVLKATQEYNESYYEGLKKGSEKAGYSKSFLDKLSDTITKTYEKIKTNYTSFVEKFWESAKGQAIKSYARHLYHEYIEKKEECEEKQAIAEQKKEEALIAEKEAQKAQEEANKKKAAADALLSKYKVNELPDNKKAKALSQISPRAALEKKWADADLKKAKDVEYDAQSAKRLAVAFAEIAEKSMRYLIALAQAQMQAIMQMSRMG